MILISIQKTSPLQTEKTLSLIELIKNGGIGGKIIICTMCFTIDGCLYLF